MTGKRNGEDRENQMKGNGKYWKQKKEREWEIRKGKQKDRKIVK